MAPVRMIKPAGIVWPQTPTENWTLRNDAGYWLRDDKGNLTKAFKHICWDGCMFPNEKMMQQQTWNDILAAMMV